MDINSVSTGSKAAEDLRAFRARKRLSQKAFAAIANIGDAAAVSRFETGHTLPSLKTAARIEFLTGIRCRDWIDEAEIAQDLTETPPPAGSAAVEVEREAGAA